jgi:hypothetical protein
MATNRREPMVEPVAIAALRPTQITVGMREVAEKRRRWHEKDDRAAATFLGRHMLPAVLGPKKRHYIIDHHHLARALLDAGEAHVLTDVVADLSHLDRDAFWVVLDNRRWMHPFDARGRRRPYDEIPKSMADLVDDPFRSLAGALRRAGGFAKELTAFSEFLWADFLRRRIKLKEVEGDFDRALERALQLAKSEAASYLPGWCGPAPEE